MSHEALMKSVIGPYGNADLILNGDDRPIKDMFVQYN
jgi:hypothetical protein